MFDTLGVYLMPGTDQFQLMELIKESDPDGIEYIITYLY